MNEIVTSQLTEENLKDIAELEKSIFMHSAYSEKAVFEMYESSEYLLIGFLRRNKLLGYIILHDALDVYEVMKIAVAAEARREGIAEKLLQYYLKLKKENLFLEVRESNEGAKNFYSNAGFEEIGMRKKYYPDGENALLMMLSRT